MRRTSPYVFALGLALALASCGGGEEAARRPNVLVITLDTCRVDRMSLYGYERDTTPRLKELARECALFERAFANSSFTPPSHASILTGLYPSEHGLEHWNRGLGNVPTAGELFGDAGYRTAAFSPFLTLFKIGLERGFDVAEGPEAELERDPATDEVTRVAWADAERVNALALPWLTKPSERPFFSWVHYYDAHRPYGRQGREWATKYNDFPEPEYGDEEHHYQLTPAKRAAIGMTPERARYVEDRYDGGLSYLDRKVGELIDGLRAAGVLDETILVITADHGEVFDDYAAEWFSHDPWLVDENIHVPLLVRLPDGSWAGERLGWMVESVDLLPTLLDLAGVGAGGVDFSGVSLVADGVLADPRHAAVFSERIGDDLSKKKRATPPSEAEVAAARDRMRALRSDNDKLHHYVDRGKLELWALGAETVDRAEQDPERFAQLKQAYVERMKSLRRGTAGAELDAETARLLELSGYIEGADRSSDSEAQDGAGTASGDDEDQAPDSTSGRSQ